MPESFFLGESQSRKVGFGKSRESKTSRSSILEQAKHERQLRETARRQLEAAILIESVIRAHICRLHLRAEILTSLDSKLEALSAVSATLRLKGTEFAAPRHVQTDLLRKFIFGTPISCSIKGTSSARRVVSACAMVLSGARKTNLSPLTSLCSLADGNTFEQALYSWICSSLLERALSQNIIESTMILNLEPLVDSIINPSSWGIAGPVEQRQIAAISIAQRVFTGAPALHILENALLSTTQSSFSSHSSSTLSSSSSSVSLSRVVLILAHRALGIFPGSMPGTIEFVTIARTLPLYKVCIQRFIDAVLVLPGLLSLITGTSRFQTLSSSVLYPLLNESNTIITLLEALQSNVSKMTAFSSTIVLANLFDIIDINSLRNAVERENVPSVFNSQISSSSESVLARETLCSLARVSNLLLHRSPKILFALGSFNDTTGTKSSSLLSSSSSSSLLDDENDGEDNEKQELVNVNVALEAARKRNIASYSKSLEGGIISDELIIPTGNLSLTIPSLVVTKSINLLKYRSKYIFLNTSRKTRLLVSTAIREKSFILYFDKELQRQLADIPAAVYSLSILVSSSSMSSLPSHLTSDSNEQVNGGLAFVSLLCSLHDRLTLASEIFVGPLDLKTSRPLSIRTGGRKNRKPLEAATFLLTSLFSTTISSRIGDTPPLALVWGLIFRHPQVWRFTNADASVACIELPDLTATLTLFMDALSQALLNTSDLDFQAESDLNDETSRISSNRSKLGRFPIPFFALRDVLLFLRSLLYRLFWADRAAVDVPLNRRPQSVLELMARSLKAFNAFFDKHSRIVSRIATTSLSSSSSSSSSSVSLSSPSSAGLLSSPQSLSISSSSSVLSRWPWTDDDFLWPSISQIEFSPAVILGLSSAVIDDEAMETISGDTLPIATSSSSSSSATSSIYPQQSQSLSIAERGAFSSSSSFINGRGQMDEVDHREVVEEEEEEREEDRVRGVSMEEEMNDDNTSRWEDGEFIHPSPIQAPPSSRFDRAARGASRAQLTLTSMPQVLPFRVRVELFERLRQYDKEQAGYDQGNFMMGGGPDVHISVRRTNLVDDALACFSRLSVAGDLSRAFKKRFRIQFIRPDGSSEPGIDGGGLLKEFIDSVVRDAFSPERGLFCETPDHFAYPDPTLLEAAVVATSTAGFSSSAMSSSATKQALLVFELLGLLLGKALYDGILVAPRFARFVLRKLLGRANTIDDLASYDSELHQSLMSVTRMAIEYITATNNAKKKNKSSSDATSLGSSMFSSEMDQDPVESLALTFSVTTKRGGSTSSIFTETPLLEKGDEIAVTSFNVNEYIRLVCDHRLNRQIQAPVRAFLRGFHEVIPLTWIRMFSADELQLLLSGREVGKSGFDLSDWRRSSTYAGFEEGEYYIHIFWSVVATLDPEDQAKLLAFVTSVPRPPLLGFSALTPRFCVRRMDTSLAVERGGHDKGSLPQAHTCFNQLDLPVYASENELKEKLLIAIRNSASFELT